MKFSGNFREFSPVSQVFRSFRTCSDLFGPVRIHSDAFGCIEAIRKYSEAFECIWTDSENFESFGWLSTSCGNKNWKIKGHEHRKYNRNIIWMWIVLVILMRKSIRWKLTLMKQSLNMERRALDFKEFYNSETNKSQSITHKKITCDIWRIFQNSSKYKAYMNTKESSYKDTYDWNDGINCENSSSQ